MIKLQAEACNFVKKETLAQVFSCEFCEISGNTFSYRIPPMAASFVFGIFRLNIGSIEAVLTESVDEAFEDIS